jgi:hypothetical protein
MDDLFGQLQTPSERFTQILWKVCGKGNDLHCCDHHLERFELHYRRAQEAPRYPVKSPPNLSTGAIEFS